MASQIITLPNELFISLHGAHWDIAHAIRSADIDISLTGHSGDEVFAVTVDYRSAGLTARPLGLPQVLALMIAPTGVDVAQWGWPRPLPDGGVETLITKLQAAVEASDNLTAHDRCEIVAHLESAKTAPMTGPRPIEPARSHTPGHAKLLEHGKRLSLAFAPQLAVLESKLETYRARLAVADCDILIASLSCHTELGLRLRLEPRDDGRSGFVARLNSESRRGSLRRSIDCADQLADATSTALQRYTPLSTYYRPLETVSQLVALHDLVQPTARRQRTIPRWRLHCWANDVDGALASRLPVRGLVPVEAVPDGAELCLADRDPGRWPDVHPFVRGLLLHLQFLGLSPLQSENGRIARLLLGIDLSAAGWPVLPLESAIECNYDRYIAALRSALRAGELGSLLHVMLDICDDALAIGDRMMDVIVPERVRLISALRHPDCLGPDVSPAVAWERAEELLGGLFIETLAGAENGRLILSDLEDAGVIERIATPIGALFGVPAIRELFSSLPARL